MAIRHALQGNVHLNTEVVNHQIVCGFYIFEIRATSHRGQRVKVPDKIVQSIGYCVDDIVAVISNPGLCMDRELHEPRIFSPSGHCSETAKNSHVSPYFRYSLGAPVISTNIRTVRFCVKTATILQWKFICVPDCTYIKGILINFTQMSLCNTFAMQAILYQFKRDVVAWKRLGCPQCMLRTWWQIVAMFYTGFRLLHLRKLLLRLLNHALNWTTTPPLESGKGWVVKSHRGPPGPPFTNMV